MKYRHIDPATRRSESVSKLNFRQRDLWYGLILTVDDQGRCPSNPALIRSDVWPLDDVSLQQVSDDLVELEKYGFIQLYQVGEKNYLQLLNWHKYQSGSEWLGLSDYPPPPGWKDRYRFHGKNRQIYQSDNWNQSKSLPNELKPERSPLPNDDVNVDDDVNGDGDGEENGAPSPIQRMIESVIGLPPGNAADMKALDEIEALNPTMPDIEAAYSWLSKQDKQVKYYSTLVGPIRTAIAKRVQKPMTPLEKSKAAVLQVIAEASSEEAPHGIFG